MQQDVSGFARGLEGTAVRDDQHPRPTGEVPGAVLETPDLAPERMSFSLLVSIFVELPSMGMGKKRGAVGLLAALALQQLLSIVIRG